MDKKDKIKLIVTVALVAVFIFAVSNSIKLVTKAKARRKALAGGGGKSLNGQNVLVKNLYQRLDEKTKDLELVRDPFSAAPIIKAQTPSAGLKLNGIVWDEERPQAIINDEVYMIGESIDQVIIVDIQKDKVVLNDGTKIFELNLKQY
jgi:hypothetical protein